jgi:hypothetical protein
MNGIVIPTTSLKIIILVVTSISVGSIICLGTLAFCLIFKVETNDKLLLAFVTLTGQLVGSLTGLLVNTRTSPGTNADMPKSDKPTT